MGNKYRSWEERRQIIRSIVASSNPPPLSTFDLSKSEEVYFHARSARVVDKLAKKTSSFKSYYAMPTEKPFSYVLAVVVTVLLIIGLVSIYVLMHLGLRLAAVPIFAPLAAVGAAAIGWAVVGWLSHRNTVRQNTNNMLFARFSQAPFGEALHRFHSRFGYDIHPRVTSNQMAELRRSDEESDQRAAAAVSYILNYYELLSAGVLRGDLNKDMVRDNSRGLIIFYYDKCEPHIANLNKNNPKTYENLIKVRTHYREP